MAHASGHALPEQQQMQMTHGAPNEQTSGLVYQQEMLPPTTVIWPRDGRHYEVVMMTAFEILSEAKTHCQEELPNGQICNAGPFWPSQLIFHKR